MVTRPVDPPEATEDHHYPTKTWVGIPPREAYAPRVDADALPSSRRTSSRTNRSAT